MTRTREDFIRTHLSGQEPRCGMGELITAAAYDAMYNGPHREMIRRHYEYASELALDAYDVGIKTILATMEPVGRMIDTEILLAMLDGETVKIHKRMRAINDAEVVEKYEQEE